MLISVVIPTRHRNKALAECLQRLAPGVQTLPADGYEVIVTDDGSVTTAEVLVRERFPWARWTAGPRRGPAANRNHGASLARGEWLAFTDDDCLPSAGWLAAFAAAAAAGDADVLEGRTTCDAGIHSILDEAPINLTGGNLWSCNMTIAWDSFDRLGRFDERFPHAAVEDIEFQIRVGRAGLRVRFVAAATVDHPPRRRLLGRRAGSLWEGRVLLMSLDPSTLPEWLPLHVAKIRARQLLAGRPSFVRLRFAWSVVVEVLSVLWRHRAWSRRYAGSTMIPVRPPTESIDHGSASA
jgi:GT2 family glycosyltransferase